MDNYSFENKFRNQLGKQGVNSSDVEFIMSLIRCSDLDENLKIMENDAYSKLEERNLKDQFEKACESVLMLSLMVKVLELAS